MKNGGSDYFQYMKHSTVIFPRAQSLKLEGVWLGLDGCMEFAAVLHSLERSPDLVFLLRHARTFS